MTVSSLAKATPQLTRTVGHIFIMIGGGDWTNPNNPALLPVITGTYFIGLILNMVWFVWMGIVLLRRKA